MRRGEGRGERGRVGRRVEGEGEGLVRLGWVGLGWDGTGRDGTGRVVLCCVVLCGVVVVGVVVGVGLGGFFGASDSSTALNART